MFGFSFSGLHLRTQLMLRWVVRADYAHSGVHFQGLGLYGLPLPNPSARTTGSVSREVRIHDCITQVRSVPQEQADLVQGLPTVRV